MGTNADYLTTGYSAFATEDLETVLRVFDPVYDTARMNEALGG